MISAQDVKNRIPITVALILATIMMTLDSTIANVALPHIQGSVSASQEEITWVLTSYILASAVMTPLSGWLSEKIGRKRMLLLSVGGFTFSSMLCGIANNLPELVAFRALQGLAGASLMPISQTIMLNIFPQRILPKVMSIWSSAIVLGPILGPTLGGWITEHWNWRWVFFINLPIGAIAFFVFSTFMGRDDGGRQRPFDFLGFGALALGVIGLQMMLDRGTGQDWFHAPEIWAYAILGAVGFYVFVVHTMTAEQPFFHRDLAKDANFVGGGIFGLFFNFLLFSTAALLPSFTQNLLGYSAMLSGWVTTPRGLGALLAFVFIPWLMARTDARLICLVGIVLGGWSTWEMSHFNLAMGVGPIMWAAFIQGIGTGLIFTPLTTLTFGTLSVVHRPEGTVVFTMLRNIGSSVGISVVQALVIRDSALAHARIAERISIADPMLRTVLPQWMDPSVSGGLAALNAEVTRQALMVSYDNVFSWMALAVMLLGPLLLVIRSPKPDASEHDIIVE